MPSISFHDAISRLFNGYIERLYKRLNIKRNVGYYEQNYAYSLLHIMTTTASKKLATHNLYHIGLPFIPRKKKKKIPVSLSERKKNFRFVWVTPALTIRIVVTSTEEIAFRKWPLAETYETRQNKMKKWSLATKGECPFEWVTPALKIKIVLTSNGRNCF